MREGLARVNATRHRHSATPLAALHIRRAAPWNVRRASLPPPRELCWRLLCACASAALACRFHGTALSLSCSAPAVCVCGGRGASLTFPWRPLSMLQSRGLNARVAVRSRRASGEARQGGGGWWRDVGWERVQWSRVACADRRWMQNSGRKKSEGRRETKKWRLCDAATREPKAAQEQQQQRLVSFAVFCWLCLLAGDRIELLLCACAGFKRRSAISAGSLSPAALTLARSSALLQHPQRSARIKSLREGG